MRVVFFGSGSFATPTLAAVFEGRHDVAGVVTQPARPAGRGGKLRHTPIAELARARGVELLETADVNADVAVGRIREMGPDVICVAEFGQMIRKRVRDTARMDTINLHGSLLPRLRGAAPVNWAIIRGYGQTGVTTFSLVDEMDAGPVYLKRKIDLPPHETAGELRERLATIGAEVVCETLESIERGEKPTPQDHSQATPAPRLTKEDGYLDFAAGAEAIRNRIHGTWPWPGAKALFHGQRHRDVEVSIARAETDDTPADCEPGVVDAEGMVATGGGRLGILEIKPAGKRLMAWRDFVNGYRVAAGDRFESIGER